VWMGIPSACRASLDAFGVSRRVLRLTRRAITRRSTRQPDSESRAGRTVQTAEKVSAGPAAGTARTAAAGTARTAAGTARTAAATGTATTSGRVSTA
jgi:hypothetical protein